ncbi:MAG TPA: GntR family transcriptional regulator [Chthoniobacteraceae bacterium]|nr:GntR family transcriptional regulator [Chthoniobacteraceae bacterium]
MTTPPAEIAYNHIRKQIISGELKPGKALSALGLSKEIGVSRTPVLFALRDLEKEGLVIIRPRVGAIVRSINSLEEYEELLSLRELMETFAAGLAAERRTTDDLARIEVELQKLKVLQVLKDPSEMDARRERELNLVDVTFHLRIVQAARHRLLLEEIGRQSLIHRVIFQPFQSFSPPADQVVEIQRQSLEDHLRIYQAIRDQDTDGARDAMARSFKALKKNNLLAINSVHDLQWQHPHGY